MLQILLQYFCGTDFSFSRFTSFTFQLSIPLYVFCNTLPNAVLHLPHTTIETSFQYTFLLCLDLFGKSSLFLLFSPLKISFLLWWTEKQKNSCEKFDCHNGACVSDWLLLCLSVVSYLSAVVISALKLIIWSGEQLLCAESLEQRGELVTTE